VVEGDIRNRKMRGPGKRTFKDGSVYEGTFDGPQFIPRGQGTFTDPKGNVTKCTFNMVQDEHGMEFVLANGMGTSRYANGTVYKGRFRNGMFNGHGTLTMTDGSVFEGEFQNGLADGPGSLTHADGTVEEGQFRHIAGQLVHLDMPLLVLKPGTLDPTLETLYDAERAIDERPSGAPAAAP